MDYTNKRILVLDGDSRQVLPIIKELHTLGCDVTTVNGSKWSNAYVSRYHGKRLIRDGNVPLNEFVLNQVKHEKYDVVLPLSDSSMSCITQHIDEISQYTVLPIPSREVFMRAYDKQYTMETCMNNNIPCPITKKRNEDIWDFARKVGFPLVAKPRSACGSMGLKIVRSKEQLSELLTQIDFDTYLLQEFIPQTDKQLNVHLFRDNTGETIVNLVTQKCRWYPIDGGASCFCRTVQNQEVQKTCKELLDAIDWRSYCEIELIIDPRDQLPKVMEINGRASASIKICDLAGINMAEYMLALALENPIENVQDVNRDVRMRCILTDFLWFIQSPNRFRTDPSWFSVKRTHDQLFSLNDPLPLFTYALQMIPNYRREMRKRKRI